MARVVPIDHLFAFQVEHLPAQLERAVLACADRIDSGSFYVRIERRGHAGDIHSQPREQELGRALLLHLRDQGAKPRIDFKNHECGVGLITRTTRERFPFVRVL